MNDEYTYSQIPKLSAGNYRVTVEAATLKRASTREPMIEYLFRVMNDGQQERRGRIEQIITPETYERMMDNLNVCGINCPARDIASYLPRARGIELDITISDQRAAHAVTFKRRLDNRSLSERGISEEVETLPDYGAMFGAALGDNTQIKVHSIEGWECGDSLLFELDPNFQIIEGEQ
jgi:hypothetical protein